MSDLVDIKVGDTNYKYPVIFPIINHTLIYQIT